MTVRSEQKASENDDYGMVENTRNFDTRIESENDALCLFGLWVLYTHSITNLIQSMLLFDDLLMVANL